MSVGNVQILLMISVCLTSVDLANAQTCSTNEFACISATKCIPLSKVNNGVDDCGDNSDEVSQPDACINADARYTCGNGMGCISAVNVNDGVSDCATGVDERKVVGSECIMNPANRRRGDCCPCTMYINNSVCVPNGRTPVRIGIDGNCRCLNGSRRNELGTTCTIRIMGDPCVEDQDCFSAVPNTACINQVCACRIGFYLVGASTCVRRKIDDSCGTHKDCYTVVPNSNCIGRCVCNGGFLVTSDKMQCIEPRIGSMQCTARSECLTFFNDTVCTGGICRCSSTYNSNTANNACRLITLGSSCLDNSNCLAVQSSECRGNQCACRPGYKSISSTVCVPRYLGDRCGSDTDCSVVANSLCRTSDDTCACVGGYQDPGSGRVCNRRLINDPCTVHADCAVVINLSTCSEGLCKCLPGYKSSGNPQSCELLGINDQCSRADDCKMSGISNINCTGGVCKCLNGFEPTPTITDCQKKFIEFVDCTTNSDCLVIVNNSSCVQNNCACATGFHVSQDNSSCIIKQVGSTSCTVNSYCSQVLPGTVCSNGFCICTVGFYSSIDRTSCVNVVIDSTSCHSDYDCQMAIYNSHCTSHGVCKCENQYRSITGRSCVAEILGLDCLEDGHCTPFHANSICSNSTGRPVCTCAEGYFSTNQVTCSDNRPAARNECTTLHEAYGVSCFVLIGWLVTAKIVA